MRFLHVGDLHLGKRLNEFNLLEDQRFLLEQLLNLAEENGADALLLAGDLYDKAVPSAEAVELLDWFLSRARAEGLLCFLISGNHDSAERVGFAASLLGRAGVYISPPYSGTLEPVTLRDAYGELDVYLMPFLRPAAVRPYFPEVEVGSFEDGVRKALSGLPLHPERRNVLVSHQFVTASGREPERSESETVYVGGLDRVDVSVYDGFDYVALGHIHRPQQIGRETVRYSGSPLKYSFSEAKWEKSAVLVELEEKGTVTVRLLPLKPLRDMREIRGSLADLLSPDFSGGLPREDYYRAILTDDFVLDAVGKLREVYPNLMKLEFDNSVTRATALFSLGDAEGKRDELELFETFFTQQNGKPMTEEQDALVKDLLREIREEENA